MTVFGRVSDRSIADPNHNATKILTLIAQVELGVCSCLSPIPTLMWESRGAAAALEEESFSDVFDYFAPPHGRR